MSRRGVVLSLLICLLASPASALLSPLGAAASVVTVGVEHSDRALPKQYCFPSGGIRQ